MNIYLVERTDDVDYDEYDAFVVAAPGPKTALKYLDTKYRVDYTYTDWPGTSKTAKLIGTTDKYTKTTEILGSFNAG